jgi:hypothetical protein
MRHFGRQHWSACLQRATYESLCRAQREAAFLSVSGHHREGHEGGGRKIGEEGRLGCGDQLEEGGNSTSPPTGTSPGILVFSNINVVPFASKLSKVERLKKQRLEEALPVG